ncbi:MAG: sugar phosphate isomerase/epimerase family protein [Oceanipulchritudo sp.]
MELAIISDEISLDLEESLRHGKEFGIHTYEVRCLDDYDHRVPDVRPERIAELEKAVSSEAIRLTALSPGTFKIQLGESEKLRHQMEDILPRSCELARRLGATRIITFGFMREEGGSLEEALFRLREAGTVAGRYGLELSIENEPGSYCDTGVNTAEVVRAIDLPHVGVNWDPANAVFAGEAAFPVGYDAVLPHIQNVHIKDGIPLPAGKWENRLLGDGGVNWVGQLHALLRDQPVPHLTLETHVFPLLESTREDLRRLDILFSAARDLGNPPSQ